MSESESLVVLMGDRRYRVERSWASSPPDLKLGTISQLAVDSRGRVHIYRREDPPIVVFDADGAFAGTWGDGRIADAHGIFISPDDRVFLVDRNAHQVLIFANDGTPLDTIGERHVPSFQAPFNHPTDVAVATDGEIYVSDGYGNSAVHRFSATGELISSWGSPGTGPGEFSTPHGIWLDRADRVLVTDRENDRVQLFDRDGGYLGEWGDFYHPMDLYEDDRGCVIVTDQTPRLSLIAPEGQLIGRCSPPGAMAHGIGGNSAGDVFLAMMYPGQVMKLAIID